ncbi:MAG: sigma-70 family RNA polymerase sigma factor [Anaerolineales bacterium]|nr:sigma-70 family RNA polymerase sigma factor [Anaerolineales bacterium]
MVHVMDEGALIRDAQRGDLTAFNRLVLAYQTLAFNVAFRIMGEPASAEDATQEAFISAYRNIKRFRGGSFRSWILRIVTNACYDELRRRKRRPAVSLEELITFSNGSESDDPGLPVSHEYTPEIAAQRSELTGAIQDCINRLPDEFRIVVVLVDVQGFDYKEVSSIIEKPLGTVKSRLARGRVRIRECLQRYRELLPAAFRLENEAK